MLFTPEELHTKALEMVQKESKSWLYKDLVEYITDWFMLNNELSLLVRPIDLKKMFFFSNMKVEISFIKKVLKDEFKKVTVTKRYFPYGDSNKVLAKVYEFNRDDYIESDDESKRQMEIDEPF
jgi:hypothetical protein